MNIKALLLSVITLAAALPMAADIPVGTWRSHLSYRSVTAVEETPGKIFAIGDGHLFSCGKKDSVITKYSKVDGFSENSVSCIKYDWLSGQLVIAYKNSNIDIVTSNGDIINIPDIKDKSLAVDKGINRISFYNSDAYLGTDFGIVVLNLKKYEVKDTYIIGNDAKMDPVYAVTSDGKYFYALMDGQIKVAPVKGKNLLDYKNWDGTKVKLPDAEKSYSDLLYYYGKLLLCEEKGAIYEFSDGIWRTLYEYSGGNVSTFFHTSKDYLTISTGKDKYFASPSWEVSGPYDLGCNDVLLSEGSLWLALSGNNGLGCISLEDGVLHYVTVDAPALGSAQRIYYDKGRIVVAPGSSWKDRGRVDGGILFFENDKWKSYTAAETGARSIAPDGVFMDVVSVAVDPQNANHWFASTWGEGVYEFLDGKAIKLHSYNNTDNVIKHHSLVSEHNWAHYTRVDGLKYDADGKLWALSSIASSVSSINVVGYMTQDGLWHEASGYAPAQNTEMLRTIMFHSSGQHWLLTCHTKPYIIVKSDNKKTSFSTFTDKDGNTVTPSFLYDIVEDKDGTVWVGTSDGPILFQNTGNVFNSTYRITRVKIPRNDGSGLADYLLNGIAVKALAVDGGNRKWIGTETAGLYVVSADGLTTINHFTTDNSPLPSNDITSIAINPENGSVFIGTADGIVEYRDGVTEPEKKLDEKNFVVFPNPVLPDYTGLITLTGLEENTVVKVVNASGYLVYQGTSTGGTFTWNGRNFNGDNVGGGVYFFHLMNTSENNSRSSAAKVLIIR